MALTAHRYWRLIIIQSTSNVSAISRLEFRSTFGGPDIAPGKPILTLNAWTDVANLFDGDDSTFGYTAGSASRNQPYAVGIDFGATAGNWPVIQEIAIRNRGAGGGGTEAQAPVSFAVQYSDDNENWTVAFFNVTPDWTALGTLRVFSSPGATGFVLNVSAPPVDDGPNAVALTAFGDAAVEDNRFSFPDGLGYYANVNPGYAITRLPYQFTVNIGAVLSSSTAFFGIMTLGNGSDRFFIGGNGQELFDISVFEDTRFVCSAPNTISGVNPFDITVTVDGALLTLYVDGTQKAQGQLQTGVLAPQLYLGTDPIATSSRSMIGGFGRTQIRYGVFAPISIMPLSGPLADGTEARSYSQALVASGGDPPYSFHVIIGALPDGLTLDPDTGRISGGPSTAGDYSFTVEAVDSVGSGIIATYSIHVAAAPAGNHYGQMMVG